MDEQTLGKKSKHIYLLWTIRLTLIISILINVGIIVFQLLLDHQITQGEILSAASKRIELLFWAPITLILTFVPNYIKKKGNIHLPNLLEAVIVVFIYAGIFLSVQFELYYRFFWWDDLLHAFSGVIMGFIGFILIYKINKKYSMNISPILVAVFAFTFALTIGVLWEILEFTMDAFLGTANQKWNLPATEKLIGKSYQGSGLRDTMSDLIVDSVGALITSVICYFLYRNEKRKTLHMMREVFPDKN